ncbi:hypothetical protein GCM10007160_13390 [Litchfieldella qijiaojingensis]|uniref:Efflux RND transporter periplasmic adaptor subunit n=1 Tax=Litchfieldella qijiaojingensis TaxID=980347 RepID=A0ABQ2YL79_9GAMM|nr:efflux RND transporter periplasmic adaptor subunit [Halomonas qijiaojingensis]GGX87373.1 hypothetical protein GCM10007160_13390 [Halomonas qijiaojingensis]
MAFRRPSLSFLLATSCGLALLLWLAFGDLQRFRAEAPEAEPLAPAPLPRVEVRLSTQEPYRPSLVAQGQLMPWREVALRSLASSQVTSLAVEEGQEVAAGDLLLSLDQEDLPAQLEHAEADLRLARAELAGAERLRARDLISDTERLRMISAVAEAEADVENLRQRLSHTRPKAPFAGRIDRLDIEEGDVLQSGENYALLIDDQRLKAQASVSQRDALALDPGLEVRLTLLDGSQLNGELTYVSSRADPSTRTFTIEAQADNPDRRRLGGASATLNITLPERQAHTLSPALLVLDGAGHLGVKTLDEHNRVEFQRVTLLSTDNHRAWVGGLPRRVRLITLGGGFVEAGDCVAAVPAAPDTIPGEGTMLAAGRPTAECDTERH